MRLIREAVQGGSRLEEGEAGIRGPASSVRNTRARRALRARVATAGFAARVRRERAGHEGRKSPPRRLPLPCSCCSRLRERRARRRRARRGVPWRFPRGRPSRLPPRWLPWWLLLRSRFRRRGLRGLSPVIPVPWVPVLSVSVLPLSTPGRPGPGRWISASLPAPDAVDRGPLGPARGLLRHRLLSPAGRWRDGPVPVGLGAGRAGAAATAVEPPDVRPAPLGNPSDSFSTLARLSKVGSTQPKARRRQR